MSRILIGIKRSPFKLATSTFIAYSICWTIIEPLLGMLKSAEYYLSGGNKYLLLILLSFCIGIYRVIPSNEINIRYNNSKIKIVFGDLFKYEGIKAIPVSRYFFETEVIRSSLQYTLIEKFINNNEGIRGIEEYTDSLESALKKEPFKWIQRDGNMEREKYYELGTTALVKIDSKNDFILFSISETEMNGYIQENNCCTKNMWIALEKFWDDARKKARGKAINIPLIGSGITGINLAPARILELNLLSIISCISEKGSITADEIRIVLHDSYFELIDLSILESSWKST